MWVSFLLTTLTWTIDDCFLVCLLRVSSSDVTSSSLLLCTFYETVFAASYCNAKGRSTLHTYTKRRKARLSAGYACTSSSQLYPVCVIILYSILREREEWSIGHVNVWSLHLARNCPVHAPQFAPALRLYLHAPSRSVLGSFFSEPLVFRLNYDISFQDSSPSLTGAE